MFLARLTVIADGLVWEESPGFSGAAASMTGIPHAFLPVSVGRAFEATCVVNNGREVGGLAQAEAHAKHATNRNLECAMIVECVDSPSFESGVQVVVLLSPYIIPVRVVLRCTVLQ